jgi:mannose-6-phosphate isomerase
MNTLYPLKFYPIFKDKIWGGNKIKTILNKDFSPLSNCGESWELSAIKGDISIVSNGFLEGNNIQELIEIYMGDLLGDNVYQKFGIEFPLLIKFIDSNDKLSVQVHPDDELALKRHNAYGKTEMWYIIDADKDAKLINGFNRKISKEEFIKYIDQKKIIEILNFEKVNNGDVFYIPAGKVHALGSGILLAEIQQTSDITYRIYDWDRLDSKGKSRQLHTELAIDAIDYDNKNNSKIIYPRVLNNANQIVSCQYFTTNIVEFNKTIDKDYNIIDSFVIFICVDGNFKIINRETLEETDVSKGEVVLLPAILKEITLIPDSYSKILEIYID